MQDAARVPMMRRRKRGERAKERKSVREKGGCGSALSRRSRVQVFGVMCVLIFRFSWLVAQCGRVFSSCSRMRAEKRLHETR